MEGSEVRDEDLVKEEDEVMNQSSVIILEYLGTIRGSYLMHTVHTMHPMNIMLKTALN